MSSRTGGGARGERPGQGRPRPSHAKPSQARPAQSTQAPSTQTRAEQNQRRQDQAARRKRERTILLAVATAIVVLIGGGIALQAWRTSRAPSVTPPPAGVSLAPVTVTDGKPLVLGAAGAPVTVTLYEDFHCPHCAEFEEKFGPTITAAQNAGTAKVELYPMAFIDDGSTAAANAMACAAEAGFGPAYYTGLFANHTLQWSSTQLVSLADQITGGSTPDTFRSCVQQGGKLSWVQSINAASDAAGVTQTPTMSVNGKPVDLTTLTVDQLGRLIEPAR